MDFSALGAGLHLDDTGGVMAIRSLVERVEKAARSRVKGKQKAKSNGKVETAVEPELLVHRTSSPTTFIEPSSDFYGKLRSKETIRIEGRAKGEIRTSKNVIVAESARVQASIHADSILIAGEVKGDVVAGRKVTLEKTARVTGDLQTCGIVIEEGAQLSGRIVIDTEEKSKLTAVRSSTTGDDVPRPAAAQRMRSAGS